MIKILALPLIILFCTVSISRGEKDSVISENDTLKVWIYFKMGCSKVENRFLIDYPDRTKKRLDKVGWITRECDYIPEQRIIEQIRECVIKVKRYSRILDAISAEVSHSQILRIRELGFVDRVEPVRVFVKKNYINEQEEIWERRFKKQCGIFGYGRSFEQLEQINIPAVHDSGFAGAGVRIALFDTGFRKEHLAFRRIINEGRLISEYDFVFEDENVQDEIPDDTTKEGRQNSHGTAVWSIISGFVPDTLIGAAYNAEFLLAKTERLGSETTEEEDNYVAAIEWADYWGADIISTSLAYRDFDDFEYEFEDLDGETAVTTKAVNWAFKRGILVVTAAGNWASKYPDGGLYTPADAFGALSVGAVDSSGSITGFSSHGPTADGRIKPDLCAMGVGNFFAWDDTKEAYRTGGGTSFATPIIAGAAALIIERYPGWGPDAVIQELKRSASMADEPDDYYGWGIPDIWKVIFGREDIGFPKISLVRSKITVFPNPSSDVANLFFEWGRSSLLIKAPVQLKIFDIMGRIIWSKNIVAGSEGLREMIAWDLMDNSCRRVPSGVYFVYLKSGRDEKISKISVSH